MTTQPDQPVDELKLTDFTEQELDIADALGFKNKLPLDKNLFDGGCLCHVTPKDSDRACGNHAQIIHQIRQVSALIQAECNRARIDQVMQDSMSFDLCSHVDESEYIKVRDEIVAELQQIMKEGK